MKKHTRILALVLAVLTMVSMLAACGAPAEETKAPSEDKTDASETTVAKNDGEKVVLRVQMIGDFQSDDKTDALTGEKTLGMHVVEEEFEKQNPNIDLQYIFMGWDDYQKKTLTMMMAKECDVYQAPGIASLADQGLVEPLAPYIEKDNFDLGVFVDNQVEGWMAKGIDDTEPQVYGLPMIADTRMIIYDKQLFDEWGVEYLSEAPTMEEVLEKAAKMTGTNPKTGVQNFGITFKAKDIADTVMNLNEHFGGVWGEGWKATEMKVNFNTEPMKKALEAMVEALKYAPEGVMSNQGAELFQTADNNIAINLRCGPGYIKSIEKLGLGDRYAVARLFINEEVGAGDLFVGSPIIIASNSDVKDAAWEYLKFTATDFFSEHMWNNGFNISPLKSAVNYETIKNSVMWTDCYETLQYRWAPRYCYESGQTHNILHTACEDVMLNGKDIGTVLEAAQKEADDWIAMQ